MNIIKKLLGFKDKPTYTIPEIENAVEKVNKKDKEKLIKFKSIKDEDEKLIAAKFLIEVGEKELSSPYSEYKESFIILVNDEPYSVLGDSVHKTKQGAKTKLTHFFELNKVPHTKNESNVIISGKDIRELLEEEGIIKYKSIK